MNTDLQFELKKNSEAKHPINYFNLYQLKKRK